MPRSILVLNAGSSSIKFELFRVDGAAPLSLLQGEAEGLGATPSLHVKPRVGDRLDYPIDAGAGHDRAIARIIAVLDDLGALDDLIGAAHRVVHGGTAFTAPVVIDDQVIAGLEALVPLAPLHQPHNLAGIRAIAEERPGLPQVACFDTAFHAGQDWRAQAFALPWSYFEKGVRRYGFHGLSYEYVAARLPEVMGADAARGRIVIAHLGNGASLCAIRDGRSVASTMGFTALDGLMMGTRTGTIDPGVILHLIEQEGLSPAAVTRLLYKESGLLGVSGRSQDVRALLAADDAASRRALDLFAYRAARELGSLVAALDGLDAVVFTAGIGQHAAPVRAAIAGLSAWTGLVLDPAANAAHASRISAAGSTVTAWVVPTDEEAAIAAHAARLLSTTARD
ncbi:acetate/propionate family kinase [Zavarzinia sp. CC-PAN008]|uniref:acetate/propionate family kinase n=1 Tax=Zavarzinia sp. CC-PAN008 TaxID=3243332 RepID=UPI003F747AE5